MFDRLKYLISLGRDRVINDPALLIEMLRIYSKIYLNGKPCELCKHKHIIYFNQLETNGLKILEKMADQQFILKDNVLIDIRGKGQFTKYNMSDEIAIERLREFPQRIDEFISYPKNWEDIVFPKKSEPKEEKTDAMAKEVEPKKPRKPRAKTVKK